MIGLLISTVFASSQPALRPEEAAVQVRSAAPDNAEMDRTLGIRRVHSFDEFVACVRARNSAAEIRSYISAPSMDVKVQRYGRFISTCAPAANVSLRFDLGALDRALGSEEAN